MVSQPLPLGAPWRAAPAVVLRGHGNSVNAAAWSTHDTLLATGSADASVRVRNTTSLLLVETGRTTASRQRGGVELPRHPARLGQRRRQRAGAKHHVAAAS